MGGVALLKNREFWVGVLIVACVVWALETNRAAMRSMTPAERTAQSAESGRP